MLIVISLIALPQAVPAQSMLWPVADKEAGTDILCKPQEYLEQKLNFESIFIGGAEDDWIVSPADGFIQSIGVVYINDLNSSLFGSFFLRIFLVLFDLFISSMNFSSAICSA